MPKPEMPPGCALVRITDLAALIAAQPRSVPAALPTDAWSGLASAVAMVTARLGRHDVDVGQLADENDTASVIHALVAMASTGIRGCLEDGAEAFLRDLGLIAAARGRGPDGEPL